MAEDRCTVSQMADVIMEGLEEYAQLAADDMKKAVKNAVGITKNEVGITKNAVVIKKSAIVIKKSAAAIPKNAAEVPQSFDVVSDNKYGCATKELSMK